MKTLQKLVPNSSKVYKLIIIQLLHSSCVYFLNFLPLDLESDGPMNPLSIDRQSVDARRSDRIPEAITGPDPDDEQDE